MLFDVRTIIMLSSLVTLLVGGCLLFTVRGFRGVLRQSLKRWAMGVILQAAAWYQDAGQFWPPQYLPGRDQAYRNSPRERMDLTELRVRARPASHEVKA